MNWKQEVSDEQIQGSLDQPNLQGSDPSTAIVILHLPWSQPLGRKQKVAKRSSCFAHQKLLIQLI